MLCAPMKHLAQRNQLIRFFENPSSTREQWQALRQTLTPQVYYSFNNWKNAPSQIGWRARFGPKHLR